MNELMSIITEWNYPDLKEISMDERVWIFRTERKFSLCHC